MSLSELVSAVLATLGVAVYCLGTLGLIRFPDLFTRLHALTKADNVGLGLVVAALAVAADSWTEAFALLALWVIVMAASATSAHAVTRVALRWGVEPWRGDSR